MKGLVGRYARGYGMVFVLLALCGYFSVVTMTEQQLRGVEAADRLLSEIRGGRVLIVGRGVDEDRAFLERLAVGVRRVGGEVVGRVEGEPRDARLALERLVAAGERVEVIATTEECAGWPVLQGVGGRFPALGEPRVVVPGSYRWPTFLTRQNLLNVANQIGVVAILAVGMTVVVITGGVDLSVGSLIALSAVGVGVLIRDHAGGVEAGPVGLFFCSLAAVMMCGLIGLGSGVMVAWFRVPPFIATLAVMQVASGLAFIVAKGGSVYEMPDRFTWLGRGVGVMGMPHAVVLMLGLYVLTHVLMRRTVLGRRLYAVGGNAEAARLSGVNVPGVLVFAYVFCGLMAGLGGVLQASQLKSGAPTYGQMYELYAIAAVVVGGTSLSGGEGRVFGTLVGALIIGVIQNGMNLTGVESYVQKVVLGLVILGAVLLDVFKGWRRLSRWFGFKWVRGRDG